MVTRYKLTFADCQKSDSKPLYSNKVAYLFVRLGASVEGPSSFPLVVKSAFFFFFIL